jgi:hypothetical protein
MDATISIQRGQRIASIDAAQVGKASSIVVDVQATSVLVTIVHSASPFVHTIRVDWSVDANASGASIIGAMNRIITVDFFMVAQSISSTSINGTIITIIAVSVVGEVGAASNVYIAQIIGAFQGINAQRVVGSENAVACKDIAEVFGTRNIIFTDNHFEVAATFVGAVVRISTSSSRIADWDVAVFFGAPVILRHINALAKVNVANVLSAVHKVITKVVASLMDANSGGDVAVIKCASNLIITVDGSVNTRILKTQSLVANINGTWITIIAPAVHGNSDTTAFLESGSFHFAEEFVGTVDIIVTKEYIDGVLAVINGNVG